ncbi:hypothetical protein WJX72_009748 [[Myrmecia] bisecta]|uniref:SAND domain-containing protein n=1 Tax=[Myrmecia] bisecta TaxID=41462 RepID=A0AAW1PMC1_9CHLO
MPGLNLMMPFRTQVVRTTPGNGHAGTRPATAHTLTGQSAGTQGMDPTLPQAAYRQAHPACSTRPGNPALPLPQHPSQTTEMSSSRNAGSPAHAVLVEEQRRKLEARIQSLGGQLGAEWYIKVRLRTGGKTAGQHDFHYYNGDNKAFLSMDQVARSLGLSVPVRSKAKDRRTPSKAERPAAVQAAGERPAKRQKNTPKPPVQPASYPFSTVEVECNGMPGVLHLAPPKWHIVCRCDTCLAASESGVKFPTGGERGFNVHAGKGPSKSWKRSVKIRLPGNAGTQDITTFMAAYNIRIPNTRRAQQARSLSSARKSTGRAPSAAAAGGSGLTAKVPPVKTKETLAAAQQQIEALQRELALEKRLAEQVLEEERAQSAAELQRLKERNAQLMRKNLELQAG